MLAEEISFEAFERDEVALHSSVSQAMDATASIVSFIPVACYRLSGRWIPDLSACCLIGCTSHMFQTVEYRSCCG